MTIGHLRKAFENVSDDAQINFVRVVAFEPRRKSPLINVEIFGVAAGTEADDLNPFMLLGLKIDGEATEDDAVQRALNGDDRKQTPTISYKGTVE